MARRRLVGIAVGVALALVACSADDGNDVTTSVAPPPTPPVSARPSTTAAASTTVTSTTPTTSTAGPAAPEGFGTARTVDDLLALGRPIVLAHTGGEDEFPGSTMFAFAESVRAGVDMLDLNVVLSSDGVLMVQHDETVDRQTEASGDVASMSAAELQALDNAYWFTRDGVGRGHPDEAYVYRGVRTGDVAPPPGYVADDFNIPRLDELIARFPDVPLNIELKGEGPAAAAAAEALATLLRDAGRAGASVVTSFDDATVAAFGAIAPDIELSPGLDASTAFVLGGTPLPDGMRILQLPPEYEGIPVLTPETVAAAHAAGYVIWVWPTSAETPELYDSLLAQGMDGLNANFPADAIEAVQRAVGAS